MGLEYAYFLEHIAEEHITSISDIKSHIFWAKPMASVWLIKTNRTRKEIMRLLRSAADANDKFLVIEVTNDWIAINIPDSVITWMKSKI